jgi:hypothetical protein|tara:strand:+ start:303 stop:518 length:216 start_codon:yes stop_codon:yes gene_type:complete
MSKLDVTLNDDRSSFDKFCDKMHSEYKKEKSEENERDIMSKEEYRVQHKMFLRHKYREKKAEDLKKKLGLD